VMLYIHTLPEAISIITHPIDQMSAALPCPSVLDFIKTSGAMYARTFDFM